MPELKRNFAQGKMNKDLDERLIPNGEYRDALNIQVVTSEGSDVGAVENINGNRILNTLEFKEPYWDGERQAFDRDGMPLGYNFGARSSDSYITSFSPTAETVGAVADERSKKIYSLVANAVDYEDKPLVSGSSGSYKGGVRSDVILEVDTENLNDDFVFVDCWQVQRQWGTFDGGKSSYNDDITTAPGTTITTTDSTTTVKLHQDDYYNYLNGLVVGMEVECINSSGDNIWESAGKVTLINFGAYYDETAAGDHYVFITMDNGGSDTSNTDINNYLRFTKPERLLNFNTGDKLHGVSKEILNGGVPGVTFHGYNRTVTSIGNKITAIDTFDGLLYWTDGVSEPKKINIERSKAGTFNQNPYRTTEFLYLDHANVYQRSKIELTDITVIKRAPLNPPDMVLSYSARSGNTHKIGIAEKDFYGEDVGNTVTLTVSSNVYGNTINPTGWVNGDLILLQSVDANTFTSDVTTSNIKSDGYEIKVRISDTQFDNSPFPTITSFTAEIEDISPNFVQHINSAGFGLKWEAQVVETSKEPLFKEKFVRFASRWRYLDGEVSALSPFTSVAFLPSKMYKYSSKESFNEAMVNGVHKITLHRFLPKDMPKEVEEVDILYKEDGNNNIYLLKNIKRKDRNPGSPVSFPWIENGPISVEGAYSEDKGSLEIIGSTFGSVIPSNQILRPFDAVPRKAKAQVISASRLMYGNYTENYDLKDSSGNNIDVLFNDWRGKGLSTSIRSKNIKGAYYGDLAIKSGRSYTVGMVYKDKFGRESSVIVGETSTIDIPYTLSRGRVINAPLDHNPPSWAEYFKFFVKENSNEYYNMTAHRAFSAMTNGKTLETWLVFNSADRNKIKEGDYLIPKRNARSGSVFSAKEEYKVVKISNETPVEIRGGFSSIDSMGTSPDDALEALESFDPASDQAGKFFVKVKNNKALTNAMGTNSNPFYDWSANDGGTRVWPIKAVFEVKPDPTVDLDVFYEVPKTYPVQLNFDNVNNAITVGDKFLIYYKSYSLLGSSPSHEKLDDTHDPESFPYYDSVKCVIKRVDGPRLKGGLTKITFETPVDIGPNHNHSSPGTVHIYDRFGGRIVYELAWVNPGSNATTNYDPSGLSTDTIYIKSWSHTEIGLPFSNCVNFKNGVESNRIRDDFNAITIKNGVKVSTTSSNYKENQVKGGIIFSGIYNSKNGVNNLNQFISAEGIKKDLNPQFGSIQKMHARDTDITVCCQDKIVKVLANKDALFNADGSNNVTSTKSVLGQTIAYQGDYGIGNNPESFVSEEFRSYFVDTSRGAVLRLSKDGLTNIASQGMGDFFADVFRTTQIAIGSYNRDKGEYDLSIYYDIVDDGEFADGQKKHKTISYNEFVKGWTSFKSYEMEQGVSLNNKYYTFSKGQTYLHDEDAVRNNFFGQQYFSRVTPIINEMPGSVKSFTSLNYEGSQGRTILVDMGEGEEGGFDDGSQPWGVTAVPDGEYYNNQSISGWYASSVKTNFDEGVVDQFRKKEGKWFNYIKDKPTGLSFASPSIKTINELDVSNLRVQGLGFFSSISSAVTGQSELTVSSDAITNASVSSYSNTIANGSNLPSSVSLTITVDPCGYIDAGDLSVDVSGISNVDSVTFSPASGDITPGETITAIVTLSGTISTDTGITLPITYSGSTSSSCVDHQVNVHLDLPASNYTYSVVSGENYTGYFDESSTESTLKYNIIGQSVFGVSNLVFTITFTADDNYYIPSLTHFDPTLTAFETPTVSTLANFSAPVKTPVYDDFGNIISISYAYYYTGLFDNRDPGDADYSDYDLFQFNNDEIESLIPEPLQIETSSEEEPESRLSAIVNISAYNWPTDGTSAGAQNLSTLNVIAPSSADNSVYIGEPKSTANGLQQVFTPAEGYLLSEASNWIFNAGTQTDITNVVFSDTADGTVTATATFSSTSNIANAINNYTYGIRTTTSLTKVSEVPYRLNILFRPAAACKITVLSMDSDLSANVVTDQYSYFIDGVVPVYDVSSSTINIARINIDSTGTDSISINTGFPGFIFPDSLVDYGTYSFTQTEIDTDSSGSIDRVQIDINWTPSDPNTTSLNLGSANSARTNTITIDSGSGNYLIS